LQNQLEIKKIERFIINGVNVVIMLLLLAQFVMAFVLGFKLIFVFGAIELNMDHVMVIANPVILET
jgi:hypothetical protein